jgi:carboxyl-terminal processing protease
LYSDKTIVAKFQTYLTKSGLEISVSNNDALVKKYMSAEFARQLFGENQYYQILLKDDAMLKAILK